MRRSSAVIILACLLLTWWFCHGLSVTAQQGEECTLATQNGDVNDDGDLDLSDPVHLLQYLFLGGEAPCALARGCDICVTTAQAELLSELEFGRRVAGTYGSASGGSGALITLTPFGTYMGAGANDFLPHATGHRFDSPRFGAWKRTGERQITLTDLSFHHDEQGALVEIMKMVSVVDISEDFQEGFGSSTIQWFSPKATAIETLALGECDAVPDSVVDGGGFYVKRLCAYPQEP